MLDQNFNRNRRYSWVIIILIIVLSLSLYFIYKEKAKGAVQTKEIEETEEYIKVKEALIKIEKGTVTGFKDGKKEWEIKADEISLGKDRKSTIFEKIGETIIFKDNKPYLKIQLKRVIANMGDKSMELVGDVVIETEEGDVLKGDRFFWDSEEETLASLEPVEVIVRENKITADQLSTDIELNKLELKGNVNVTFIIN